MEKEVPVKTKIENAVVDFMKTGEFPNISVADVAKKAEVSKSTFYRHYKDIYDVYEQLVDGIVERCKSLLYKIFFGNTMTLKQLILILLKNGIHKDNELFFEKDYVILNYSIRNRDEKALETLYSKLHTLIFHLAKEVYDDDEAADFGATFILYGNFIPILSSIYNNGKLNLKTLVITFDLFQTEVEKWKR